MENQLEELKKKAIEAYKKSCIHNMWDCCGLESAYEEKCDEGIGCGGLHCFMNELDKQLKIKLCH